MNKEEMEFEAVTSGAKLGIVKELMMMTGGIQDNPLEWLNSINRVAETFDLFTRLAVGSVIEYYFTNKSAVLFTYDGMAEMQDEEQEEDETWYRLMIQSVSDGMVTGYIEKIEFPKAEEKKYKVVRYELSQTLTCKVSLAIPENADPRHYEDVAIMKAEGMDWDDWEEKRYGTECDDYCVENIDLTADEIYEGYGVSNEEDFEYYEE